MPSVKKLPYVIFSLQKTIKLINSLISVYDYNLKSVSLVKLLFTKLTLLIFKIPFKLASYKPPL